MLQTHYFQLIFNFCWIRILIILLPVTPPLSLDKMKTNIFIGTLFRSGDLFNRILTYKVLSWLTFLFKAPQPHNVKLTLYIQIGHEGFLSDYS
jgi:hypothetical protein